MTSTKTHPRERVARNFIKRYGMTRFREMITAFGENRSGAEIGKMLGVSRERVRQWRNTFGMMVTFYLPYPETKRLLGDRVE